MPHWLEEISFSLRVTADVLKKSDSFGLRLEAMRALTREAAEFAAEVGLVSIGQLHRDVGEARILASQAFGGPLEAEDARQRFGREPRGSQAAPFQRA